MTVKTNERPGTKATLRYCRISSYKAREVLDLIRGLDYTRAVELLDHTNRAGAPIIAKLLRSAASNAEHNDQLFSEELYVATAYADEGATLKRWRPRARGRATRIRKRTCHITVVLARMPEDQVARLKARAAAQQADRRARRVAGSRRRAEQVDQAAEEAPELPLGEAEEHGESPADGAEAETIAEEAPEARAAASEEPALVAEPATPAGAKKTPAKRTPAKKAAAKKAPAKTATAKKEPAKKSAAKKTVKAISKITSRSARKPRTKDES
jgi:large subunit ribosomal protein L22